MQHPLERQVARLVHPELESVQLTVKDDLDHSEEVASTFMRCNNLRHSHMVVPPG